MPTLNDSCIGCKMMPKGNKGNYHGYGKFPARVMFIQDIITEADIDDEDILMSEMGIRFRKALEKRGVDTDNCYFTCAVKCPAKGDNPKPTLINSAAMTCKMNLEIEIQVVDPDVIVPMGDAAMRAITGKIGLSKGRGKAEQIDGRVILPMRHPDSALAKPMYWKHILTDLNTLADIYKNGMPTVGEVDYVYPETADEMIAEIDRLEAVCLSDPEVTLSFDLETTGRYTRRDGDKIVTIGLSVAPNTGTFIPLYHRDNLMPTPQIGSVVKRLRKALENPDTLKEAQNGKFDILWLDAWLDIKVQNFVFDPMLAHYMAVSEEPGTQGLKHMAWEFTDMGGYDNALTDYQKTLPESERYNFDNIPLEILKDYGCGDVDCLQRLRPIFRPLLEANPEWQRVYQEIFVPVSVAFAGVEKAGMHVDKHLLEQYAADYAAELDRIREKLESFPEVLEIEREKMGLWEERCAIMTIPKSQRTPEQQRKSEIYKKYQNYKFNWGSVDQLSELLFKRLNLTTPHLTDNNNPSTNEDSLEFMKEQHPIPAMLLAYRKVSTQNSMFITQLPAFLDNNNIVHPSFNPVGTVTGRTSSEKPNAQQFPRKSEHPDEFFYWRGVKSVFTSRFGRNGVIMQFDYSQLEVRIAGIISGDKTLLAGFLAGQDIHKSTAATVWNMSYDDVPKDLRSAAKAVVFGSIYQKSGNSLGADLYSIDEKGNPVPPEIYRKKGNDLLKKVLGSLKELDKWIKAIKKSMKQLKYVKTMLGTYRRLPDIDSKVNSIMANAERQGVNAPIQGTGSLMTLKSVSHNQRFLDGHWKSGTGCCHTGEDLFIPPIVRQHVNVMLKEGILDELQFKSREICTVHDSIVFDVYIPELPAIYHFVKHTMENIHRPYFDSELPIVADCEIGYSYGTMIDADPEHITGDIEALRGWLDEEYAKKREKDIATLKEKGMSDKAIAKLMGGK